MRGRHTVRFLLLAAGLAALCAKPGRWETCKLPPGETPQGAGWEPLGAVSDTDVYAPHGPKARVVWRRWIPARQRVAEPEDDLRLAES